MARWRLRGPHYLNILEPDTGEPTKWEYSETDRTSGKARRKTYDVPQLLDPKDPNACNYPEEIIVCHKGLGEPRDIVFFGEPTPDMEPYDEEAERISASLQAKWTHPIETLPVNGGMNAQESAFMQSMMKAFASATPAPNTSIPSQAEFNELKAQLEEMKVMMANMSPSSMVPDEPKPSRRA